MALPETAGPQPGDAPSVTFNDPPRKKGEGRERGVNGQENTGSAFNKEHLV